MVFIKKIWFLPVLLFLFAGSATAQLPVQLTQQPGQPTQQSGQPTTTLSAIAEQAVKLLASQQYEEVRLSLHPDLRALVSAADLQQQWQQLLAVQGAYRRIVNTRSAQVYDGSIVIVTAAFEQGSEDLLVIFNDQQQIVGFDIVQLNDNIQAVSEEFVDALAAGDYALARRNFHPTLKTEVLPTNLEQAWQSTQIKNGWFQQRLSSEVRTGIDVDLVQVSVQFENTTANILITFRGSRIVGFDFP